MNDTDIEKGIKIDLEYLFNTSKLEFWSVLLFLLLSLALSLSLSFPISLRSTLFHIVLPFFLFIPGHHFLFIILFTIANIGRKCVFAPECIVFSLGVNVVDTFYKQVSYSLKI